MSGIFIIIQYSTAIFQSLKDGKDKNLPQYITGVSGIFLLVGGFMAFKFLNLYGRKKIFVYGQTLLVVVLFGFCIIAGLMDSSEEKNSI